MIRMTKATAPTVPAITFRLVAASLALLLSEERVVGICVKMVEVVPLTTTVETADVIVVANAPVSELGGGAVLCSGARD